MATQVELLISLLDEARKLHKLQEEAFADMNRELREIKCRLHDMAK